MFKDYIFYIIGIIILFILLFGVLWISYLQFNHGLDSNDYITNTNNISCYKINSQYYGCEIDRIYINATEIRTIIVNQINS